MIDVVVSRAQKSKRRIHRRHITNCCTVVTTDVTTTCGAHDTHCTVAPTHTQRAATDRQTGQTPRARMPALSCYPTNSDTCHRELDRESEQSCSLCFIWCELITRASGTNNVFVCTIQQRPRAHGPCPGGVWVTYVVYSSTFTCPKAHDISHYFATLCPC